MHSASPVKTPTYALRRFAAALIDYGIVGVIGSIPVLGPLLGVLYLLVRDRLVLKAGEPGRSCGKWLMGLEIRREDGTAVTYEVSALRNLSIAIPYAAAVLFFKPSPLVGGVLRYLPFYVGLIGIPVVLFECALILIDSRSRRLGDFFARTLVTDQDLPR